MGLFSAFSFCAEIWMALNRDKIKANTSAPVTSIKSAIHSRWHSSEMVSKRSSSSSSTGNRLQGGRTLAVCTMGDTLLSRQQHFVTEAPMMRLYFSWGRLYIAASNLVQLCLSPVLNVQVEQLSGFEPWSSLRNVWTQFDQRTPWTTKLWQWKKRGECSIDIWSLFGQMFTQLSSAKSRIIR